jgi:hypothetical protein
MLSVIILSVVILNVIMLSVMAPVRLGGRFFFPNRFVLIEI